MSLLNYIKTLLPSSFERSKIVEGCTLAQTSIRENTLPAYASADSLFKVNKPKSKEFADYSKEYDKISVKRFDAGRNLITAIHENLKNADQVLEFMMDYSKKLFSSREISQVITYKKAQALRLLSCIQFYDTYARRFLNHVFIVETQAAVGSDGVTGKLTAAELRWLKENFNNFCLISKTLERDSKNVTKALDEVPDATITEITESVLPTTTGTMKIDPFQMRHLSASMNPFFLLGMFIAELDAKRFKAAQAELELLQMRRYNLERQLDKQPDAALQREIEVLQERVTDLVYNIEQMELKYGVR